MQCDSSPTVHYDATTNTSHLFIETGSEIHEWTAPGNFLHEPADWTHVKRIVRSSIQTGPTTIQEL